ncbi:hypothetical protein NFI96_010259 [Prochilodus magdalenae]|nr:hypothetical protein NFI96_010259 [Prochilodus magdalenae]
MEEPHAAPEPQVADPWARSGKHKHKTTRREMEDQDAKKVSRLQPITTKSMEGNVPHLASVLPPLRKCWLPQGHPMQGDLPGTDPLGKGIVLVTPVQEHKDADPQLEKVSVSKAVSKLNLDDLEDDTRPYKLSSEGEEGGSHDSEILTVSPRVINFAAQEVVKDLNSSFDVELPAGILYDCLLDNMMEELQILAGIKITAQVLGGRLFPDENNAISRIVREACESLSDGRWMRGAVCPDHWTVGCIADAILNAFVNYALECIQPRSSSPETDTVKDASLVLGLPELNTSAPDSEQHSSIPGEKAENPVPTNTSAPSNTTKMGSSEFEELITDFDRSADSNESELRDDDWSEKPPVTVLPEPAESAQGDSSDVSHSIPVVRPKKKRRVLSRISKFFRRLFCFGCCPSIRVTPL